MSRGRKSVDERLRLPENPSLLILLLLSSSFPPPDVDSSRATQDFTLRLKTAWYWAQLFFVKQQPAGLSEACGETRAVFLLRNKIRIQDSDAGLRSRLVWRQREHQAAVGTVKPNMTTSGAETVKEEK